MSSEERFCPDCGGEITTMTGMGWQERRGRTHAWVGMCWDCTRTGADGTYGINSTGQLVRVKAFSL